LSDTGKEGGNVPVDISRVLGHLERDLDVGHGPQVVDLVGADLGDELRRGGRKGRREGRDESVFSVIQKAKEGRREETKQADARCISHREGGEEVVEGGG